MAPGPDLTQRSSLRFCAAGYSDPHLCRRIGRARLGRFLHRHSHGHFGDPEAVRALGAADEMLALWGDELDYGELADDIAVEARLAFRSPSRSTSSNSASRLCSAPSTPRGSCASVPGVGADQRRADPRSARRPEPVPLPCRGALVQWVVPSLDSSGQNGGHGGPTKSGDALLREALFMSADAARKIDPTLAQRYHRLMTVDGQAPQFGPVPHLGHTLTRIVSCWRSQEPYVIRDLDGQPITPEEGRRIVHDRFVVSALSENSGERRGKTWGRAGEARSRCALRRPARPVPTLGPKPLDIS